MSLTAAIITIIVLDVALLALLAFVMSRAAKLEPHLPGTEIAKSRDGRLVFSRRAVGARSERRRPDAGRVRREPQSAAR